MDTSPHLFLFLFLSWYFCLFVALKHTHTEMVSVWGVDRQSLTHFLLLLCVRVCVKSADRQCVGLWQRVSAQCQGDVFSVTLCWPDLRSDCPLRPRCGSLHNPCCHSQTSLKGSTSLCTHTHTHMQKLSDMHGTYRHPRSQSRSR